MCIFITLFLFISPSFGVNQFDLTRPTYVSQNSLLREEALVNTFICPLLQNDQQIFNTNMDDYIFEFFLYTREDLEDDGYLLTSTVENLQKSNFDSDRITKVIIHGWTDSSKALWVQEIRARYLEVSDVNVICVNWYPASTTEYFYAVNLIKKVAEQLANYLKFLEDQAHLSLLDVHLIGHSLGAHIAGFTGNHLSGKIGRITGMDPAKPLFETVIKLDSDEYLDWRDAIFVDIIHTSAGTVGFAQPVGHVDFYPNGGFATQPGCPLLVAQSCSHERSYQFMIESITYPQAFVAIKCSNWISYLFGYCKDYMHPTYMGEFVNQNVQGSYFLETNPYYPFGKGRVTNRRFYNLRMQEKT